MTTLWTFIPEDTSALIAGTHNVVGFPDESFIRISKDIPVTETRRTTDNRITRVKKTSNMYTIEMSLFSVSPTNEILTKLWQVDELTKNVDDAYVSISIAKKYRDWETDRKSVV